MGGGGHTGRKGAFAPVFEGQTRKRKIPQVEGTAQAKAEPCEVLRGHGVSEWEEVGEPFPCGDSHSPVLRPSGEAVGHCGLSSRLGGQTSCG